MCSGHLQVAMTPTPPGNSDGYQNKGLAGKAICKTMKTKGEQFALRMNHAQPEGYPHPRCFAKRVRKPLKTNDASVKKRAKREKESASLWQRRIYSV